MASIKRMVQRVKDDAVALLGPARILALCEAAGHRWRVRELDPVTLVSAMMLQVLHATSQRGTLRIAGIGVTPTAYCKAKRLFPLEVIQRLALALSQSIESQANQSSATQRSIQNKPYKLPGLPGRVVMIDGSSVSMPDTPALQNAFGQPGNAKLGCGFPVVHLLALIDQTTGTIRDLLTHPGDTHDMAHTAKLHPMLEENDILLGDRAFCSYAHLTLLLQDKLHGVLRLHQKQIVSFKVGRQHKRLLPKAKRRAAPSSRFIQRMGKQDQLVEYIKPKGCPRWMSQEAYTQLPGAITVRELRCRIPPQRGRTREVTLVTTFLDCEKYTKEELTKLYQSRWEKSGGETRLCEFKQTLGANVLRSTSEQGVLKDLWMHVLVFNLIRLLILRHARERGVDPRRLSFIDARDVLRYTDPDIQIPMLIYNPIRPGRAEPRVIKRRKDTYNVMTRPRETLRQALENKTLRP